MRLGVELPEEDAAALLRRRVRLRRAHGRAEHDLARDGGRRARRGVERRDRVLDAGELHGLLLVRGVAGGRADGDEDGVDAGHGRVERRAVGDVADKNALGGVALRAVQVLFRLGDVGHEGLDGADGRVGEGLGVQELSQAARRTRDQHVRGGSG